MNWITFLRTVIWCMYKIVWGCFAIVFQAVAMFIPFFYAIVMDYPKDHIIFRIFLIDALIAQAAVIVIVIALTISSWCHASCAKYYRNL